MKKLASLLLSMALASCLWAAFNPEYSDYQFYNLQDYDTDMSYLEACLADASDDEEKAAILWRQARTVLTMTDAIDEDDEDARLAGYGKAQSLAEESVALYETADGYHWLSSAIGRIGQVNGPLNSLSKAKPMREYIEKVQNDFNADMSDSWYVLGLLYNQLPGAPLSFGNEDYAISYMRRCIDTQDNVNRMNLTNYLELAQQLYDRNWKADKRAKEADKMQKDYKDETVPTEKMKYYEGRDGRNTKPFYSTVAISQMSDRQEAAMLCQYAMAVYGSRSNPLPSDTEKYNEIVEFYNEIT